MSAADLFLGLDIGTSGVKALLARADGDVAATGTTPLSLQTPHPGWAEQDPEAWWLASRAAIAALLAKVPGARVAAIGITGQMHSSVFLDHAGAVIRPALLWNDGRTGAECDEITRRAGGESQLRAWVCNPALAGFTLPKVLWLRHHEPAHFARLATVLLPKDYIRFRLTGVIATEPSDASGTLMFDPARLRRSDEMLDAMDLPRTLLPDVGGSAEVLGRVTRDAAEITGLAEGTPVVGGGGDNACGAAGVGVLSPGDAAASWGTSGTVLAPTAEPRVDPLMRAHTFCHVAPDTWYLIGVVLTAGGAWKWFREQFAPGLDEAEAAGAPAGSDGVIFLPYLQGDRTPHRDPSMRGAFVGLSLAHTRAHLARAVTEGVCFAMRDALGILGEIGMAPQSLVLTGGGAASAFVRRLQADIYGVSVARVNREEGPAYGAALLAGVGAGLFPDIAEAARRTLTRGPLEHPDAAAHAGYEPHYARFRAAIHAAHG